VVKFKTGIIIDDINIKTTIIITQCKITR
jgi:hypothetical protein